MQQFNKQQEENLHICGWEFQQEGIYCAKNYIDQISKKIITPKKNIKRSLKSINLPLKNQTTNMKNRISSMKQYEENIQNKQNNNVVHNFDHYHSNEIIIMHKKRNINYCQLYKNKQVMMKTETSVKKQFAQNKIFDNKSQFLKQFYTKLNSKNQTAQSFWGGQIRIDKSKRKIFQLRKSKIYNQSTLEKINNNKNQFHKLLNCSKNKFRQSFLKIQLKDEQSYKKILSLASKKALKRPLFYRQYQQIKQKIRHNRKTKAQLNLIQIKSSNYSVECMDQNMFTKKFIYS